jgi:1-acyl-sn-glycerol-3-phosphate acyltransferase
LNGLKYFWTVLAFAAHVMVGLAICAVRFPFADHWQRGRYIRWFSRRVLRLCGVRLRLPAHLEAALPHEGHFKREPPALVVANHVSWLDIFVLNSLYPCRFVSKIEVRAWPVLGWLTHRVGTIFISRAKRADVKRIFGGLVAHLKAGDRVAFFPEGRTSFQGELGQFHANLFEAAVEAQVPVHAYAIMYLRETGEYHPAVEFVGDMGALASLRAVLSADGPIVAELIDAANISSFGLRRRDLAKQAEHAVSRALGLDAVGPAGQGEASDD